MDARALFLRMAVCGCVLGAAAGAGAVELERSRLPEGSKLAHEPYATTDGKYVLLPHMIGRFWLPVTMVARGWCHNAALSVFDGASGKYINTVLLDDPDLGACEPWDVVADDKRIVVAHSGSSELSVIDRAAFERRLAERKDKDLSTDMSFMVGIRTRVKTPKQGPRKLKLENGEPVVTEYFQDQPGVTKGELLFNDARLCHQQWHSCATCHPDGRGDGQSWAFPRKAGFNQPELSCDFETLEMTDEEIDARMMRSVAPALFVNLADELPLEMGKYVRAVRKRGREREQQRKK